MPAPSTSAARATFSGWTNTELGDRSGWPDTLAVAADIVRGSPWPMLLAWGPRDILVYNDAYAALAGPHHPPAPGGNAAMMRPAPMAAAADAFARARAGEQLHLPHVALNVIGAQGAQQVECDLHLTPIRGQHGAVEGVLCALARSPERVQEAAPAGLHVLVVEDNVDSQYLVCEMLKAFGYEADGVGHAEGALELLAAGSYDVLFSDVSLPGMSGVELARQALERDPQLRVIFASGYGDALLRHLDFPYQSLQKPYEIDQLQAALAGIAEQAGAGAQPRHGQASV